MPINLSFQPSAFAVGGAALVGGQGDYMRWLNEFRNNQYQFSVNAAQNAQGMALSRMNALSQIAAQQQQQQSQQAFQMQMLPQQAAVEAQQQAYQSYLSGQNQQQNALLGAQLQQQQSQQDFQEQQQLANAHAQMQLQGQQAMADYNNQLQQQNAMLPMLQNPTATGVKNMQQVQQQGKMTFSDEAQQQINDTKGQIQDIVSNIQTPQNPGGTISSGDGMRSLMPLVSKFNTLTSSPDQPVPPTTSETIAQKVTWGWTDPQTGEVKPGTEDIPFTVDPKTGKPMVVQGYKMGQDQQQPAKMDEDTKLAYTTNAKALQSWNQDVAKMAHEIAYGPQTVKDQQTGQDRPLTPMESRALALAEIGPPDVMDPASLHPSQVANYQKKLQEVQDAQNMIRSNPHLAQFYHAPQQPAQAAGQPGAGAPAGGAIPAPPPAGIPSAGPAAAGEPQAQEAPILPQGSQPRTGPTEAQKEMQGQYQGKPGPQLTPGELNEQISQQKAEQIVATLKTPQQAQAVLQQLDAVNRGKPLDSWSTGDLFVLRRALQLSRQQQPQQGGPQPIPAGAPGGAFDPAGLQF